MISGSSRWDLKRGSVKSWFKAFWGDFYENLHAALALQVVKTAQYLRKMNLFGIWQIQNVEQIHALSVSTLPAPETFNFFFKNMIYCKKPENLHAALASQVPEKSTFPLKYET